MLSFTPGPLPLPAAEISLGATSGQANIEISWPLQEGVESYQLYRQHNGGEFIQIATGLTQTHYIDTSDLIRSDEYCYRVEGLNAAGEVRFATAPATCTQINATVNSTRAQAFWSQSFRVLWNGSEIAVCSGGEGTCDVFLPPT